MNIMIVKAPLAAKRTGIGDFVLYSILIVVISIVAWLDLYSAKENSLQGLEILSIYTAASLIVVGIFLFFSWINSFWDMRLGTFKVDGTIESILTSLHYYLRDYGAPDLQIDADGNKISMQGISKIISEENSRVCASIGGDRIDFQLKTGGINIVLISIWARRSWNSRTSYTQKELQMYGYDSQRILDSMTAFARDINSKLTIVKPAS